MKKSIVSKGDVVTVEIVDIGVNGDGICLLYTSRCV